MGTLQNRPRNLVRSKFLLVHLLQIVFIYNELCDILFFKTHCPERNHEKLQMGGLSSKFLTATYFSRFLGTQEGAKANVIELLFTQFLRNNDFKAQKGQIVDARVHASLVFIELLDPCNTSRDVWADSAYRSEESLQELQEQGFCEHIQRKGLRHKKLLGMEKRGNRTRSRISSRVEHVFGV